MKNTRRWLIVCAAFIGVVMVYLFFSSSSITQPDEYQNIIGDMSLCNSIQVKKDAEIRTFLGDEKQKIYQLLSKIRARPIDGPTPTPSPGHIWSIQGIMDDGNTAVMLLVKGKQELEIFVPEDRMIYYRISEAEEKELLLNLQELFYA
jgi:hypothetical protein